MFRKSRAGVIFFIVVLTNLMLFTVIFRNIWYSSKCMEKRDKYSTTVQNERIYPRTIYDIADDFHATECDSDDDGYFKVSSSVSNHVLHNSRFLLEPLNVEHFCDENTFLILFILSAPDDFDTRRAIRRSWANPNNIYHPSLVRALPKAIRDALDNEAVRNRFGVRTVFILGTDERVARMNEAQFAIGGPPEEHAASIDDWAKKHYGTDHFSDLDHYHGKAADEQHATKHRSTVSPRRSVASRLHEAKRRAAKNAAFKIERGLWPEEGQESQIDKMLQVESAQFGDVVQASFVDSYANLTLKVLLATKWLAARCSSARFAMKIDTDTIPNLPALIASLIERDLQESAAALDLPSFYSTGTRDALKNENESDQIRRYLTQFRTARRKGTVQDPVPVQPSSCSSFYRNQPLHDTQVALNPAPLGQPLASRHNDTAARPVRVLSDLDVPSIDDNSNSHMGHETASAEQRCVTQESEFYMAHYGPIMVGYRYGESRVRRSGRWGVKYESFPLSTYPQYLAGTAYVLSMTAVQEVFQMALHYQYFFGIEDAYITGVLGTLIRARKYDDPRFSPCNSWKPSICQFVRGYRVTATNFEVEEMLTFWESAIDAQC